MFVFLSTERKSCCQRTVYEVVLEGVSDYFIGYVSETEKLLNKSRLLYFKCVFHSFLKIAWLSFSRRIKNALLLLCIN